MTDADPAASPPPGAAPGPSPGGPSDTAPPAAPDPPPLVTGAAEAREAVLAFEAALAHSPALAARLAYPRAWVALKDEAGWHYAPALWAGHAGLSADAYLALASRLDGRRAEAALRAFCAPVTDPRRADKHARRLRALFARHAVGRAPNARLRLLEPAPDAAPADLEARVVDLVAEVARLLGPAARAALRRRLS